MNDSIGLYLNDIGKVSLLNAEEERELSRVIEKGRAAAERLENGEKGAVLKADVAKGWTNPEYATSYLERFLSKTVRAGAAALAAPWDWQPLDARGWLFLLGIGLLGSLSHYGLIRALDAADASAMQPYSYTLLVWATVMGWLVFGHIPDAWTIAGAAVVVLSGLYAWYRDRSDVTSAKP